MNFVIVNFLFNKVHFRSIIKTEFYILGSNFDLTIPVITNRFHSENSDYRSACHYRTKFSKSTVGIEHPRIPVRK